MTDRLPEQFKTSMRTLLGEDFEAYQKSFEEERVYGLRVNSRKIHPGDFQSLSPFSLQQVPWTRNGFYYDGNEKPAKHPYYYAGLYYLQEPSAMLPAAILPVSHGDYVLDLCAAPGGKSTELASKLNGTGVLVSNDISVSRSKALLKNLELFGTENSIVLSEDPKRLSTRFVECFDKILIDAPCSGEGMFRKDPSVIKSWEEHGNAFFAPLQRSIMQSAIRMLKKGGLMVYSTCTFSPHENEEILLYTKSLDPSIRILKIENRYPFFDHGLQKVGEMFDPELSNALRIYPHQVRGEGHFVALLKKGDCDAIARENGCNASLLSEKQGFLQLPDAVRVFLSRVKKLFYAGEFELRGEYVFYKTALPFDLTGLRILKNGLFLGTYRKDRFEPSEALAMALKENEFDQTLSLPASDERVIKYLKCETLDVSDLNPRDGWTLIELDHFPLGFAKSKNGILKNKYLPGWRYQ